MNLSGTLSDWTVSDLLNVMKVTGKSASLHIKGHNSGTIHFSEGKVVGAELEGRQITGESRESAADSLLVLWSLDEGTFEMVSFEGAEDEGWDVESLLGDMEGLQVLETELVEAGLRESYLMLKDEIDAPVTIEAGDWWAIASLVSVLSFAQLEEVFGRGRAIRLLHTLWRLGLMEKVEQITEDRPVMPADQPPAVDLAALAAEEGGEAQFEGPEAADRDDESWLDEIAAAAEGPAPAHEDPETAARRVMGVAAPASTVLTGSVLDEMRRLRVRPTD